VKTKSLEERRKTSTYRHQGIAPWKPVTYMYQYQSPRKLQATQPRTGEKGSGDGCSSIIGRWHGTVIRIDNVLAAKAPSEKSGLSGDTSRLRGVSSSQTSRFNDDSLAGRRFRQRFNNTKQGLNR
jgi:hypothetical protein